MNGWEVWDRDMVSVNINSAARVVLFGGGGAKVS